MRPLLLLATLAATASLTACEERPGADDPAPWPIVEAGEVLEVRVVDPSGAPVGGAWVSLAPTLRDAQANAAGEVRFTRLEASEFVARASAPGFVAATASVGLPAEAPVDIVLQPSASGATLSGTVVGPDDVPVVGAAVLVDGAERALTGPDGEWSVEGLPGGTYALAILPPPGSPLVSVDRPRLELAARGHRTIDLRLPSTPPATSSFIGSTACGTCHADQGAAWRQSAHAGGPSLPADLASDPLGAAFLSGEPIPLLAGARALPAAPAADRWTLEIRDANDASSGALDVLAVVGAGRHGRALVLGRSGAALLAPIAWDDDRGGPGDAAREGAWVAAFTEPWLNEAGALRFSPTERPPDTASFALRCGGCHATGVAAAATSATIGGWSLSTGQPDPIEYAVGCEACHGAGSQHRRQADERQADIFNQALLSPDAKEASCARCHERVSAADHPFTAPPAWPATPTGRLAPPWAPLTGVGAPAPAWWRTLDASAAHADQLGELRSSAHRLGDSDFHARCADCHDTHGTAEVASLHVDPWDNRLCTSCHATQFPDAAAQAAHSGHNAPSAGPWGSGSCVGCHMPRSGHVLAPDPLTGAGEARAHSVLPWGPYDLLAEFEAANTDTLPLGEAPVAGCIDCHRVRHALELEQGGGCPCPQGDPTQAATYESLKTSFDRMFGGSR